MKPLTKKWKAQAKTEWLHLLSTTPEEQHICGTLANGHKHCALGLLWIAAGGSFVEKKDEDDNNYFFAAGLDELIEDEDVDMHNNHAYVLFNQILDGGAASVWNYNDRNRKKTFKEIAEWVQEQGIA